MGATTNTRPGWTYDELHLVCKFLFDNHQRVPRPDDPSVQELAELLQKSRQDGPAASARHGPSADNVHRKLCDLATRLPGYTGMRTEPPAEPDRPIEFNVNLILRDYARQLARSIARFPHELARMEWRDLERMLREVLEGIGFDVELTRASKDGGYDLKIVHRLADDEPRVYLVEVKHWAEPDRPGEPEYRRLVEVVWRERAEKGLLLSTSGFRPEWTRTAAASPVRQRLHRDRAARTQEAAATWDPLRRRAARFGP